MPSQPPPQNVLVDAHGVSRADFPRPTFPLHLRLANSVGALLDRSPWQPLALTTESLMEAARKRTGLDDWGEGNFREGLEVLLRSAREDTTLHFVGRLSLREMVLRCLCQRLQLVAQARALPEALEQPVRAPVFILGLPRTGTTFLQRAMSAAPDAMSMPLWLLLHPFPCPTAQEWRAGGGARLRRTERLLRLSPTRHSGLDLRHEVRADLPEECSSVMAATFLSRVFWDGWETPGHIDWVMQQDLTPAYRWLRQWLQLQQHSLGGKHWVLKDPWHLLGLRELAATFPEAHFVHTFRDPAEVLPSVHSLMVSTHSAFSRELDLERTVEVNTRLLALATSRALEARSQVPPERFIQVSYQALIADPTETVRQLHARCGLPWTARNDQSLKTFVGDNPRHKHGVHRYSLEQFGQRRAQIHQIFAEYMEAFA